MKTSEKILNILNEESYSIAPSYNDSEGFGSVSNTEALESLYDVARYFSNYGEFLKTDKGNMYVDASMADDFINLANIINREAKNIENRWNSLQ